MPVLSEPKIPVPKSVHPDESDGIALTPDEYIVFERASLEKHDYIDGKAVLRVPGASPEHNQIVSNFFRLVGNLLEDANSLCEIYGSDTRVYISNELRVYPDAVVACEPFQYDNTDTLRNPILVLEVLSHSTQDYDKDEKWQHYQSIESLRHYVLIAQYHVEVTHYERQADGSWALAGTYTNLSESFSISLPDAQIALPLSRIYRRVSFEAETVS